REGSVSDAGAVSTELKMGALNGERFSTALSFNTSMMNRSMVSKAEIFLRRESLVGTNPIGGNMLLRIKNGVFGTTADVEVEDLSTTSDATGIPCRFGSNGGDGTWIKLRVPDELLP